MAFDTLVRRCAAVEPAWFAGQNLPALQAWLSACVESRLFDVGMTKLLPQSSGAIS